jgi:GntR family transcriptional regulator, arabinose operon transcriptional repressor
MPVQPVLTAKYRHIIDWAKAEMRSGQLRPGDKLPSESELCTRFSVSRSAVRQALALLAREGWLESRKGVGSFCTARRGATTKDLALVSYFSASYIFPGIVSAFERRAQRDGFHVVFNQSEGELDKERSILVKLAEKGVGGIAIIPINAGLDGPDCPSDLATTNHALLEELREGGTQVLLVDNNFGDGLFPSIGLDDRSVGRAAAAYMHGRGHRDLVLVYSQEHRPFKLRRQGFAEGFAELGDGARTVDLRLRRREEAEEALCDYLSRERPGGVFCANDEIAVALYRAAARLGLTIPAELSVISVDNSDYASLPGIDLTSIAHPSAFIGARAAQMLMDGMASGETRYKEVIDIEPEIIERGSVRRIQ